MGTSVAGQHVGRACPYCRFALKGTYDVVACPSCRSVHHGDCWDENRGCAIHGCPAAGSAASPPASPPPTPAAPAQWPPPPAAVAPQASPGASPRLLLGALVGLLIVLSGATAYLLASRSSTPAPARAETPSSTVTVPATSSAPTSTGARVADDPGDAPSSSFTREARVADELQQVVDDSISNRAAVRAGRYDDAIANRQEVFERLDAIRGAAGRAAAAKRTLRRAMEASLAADEAYANGGDATVHDAAATRLKRAFVRQYEPVASDHDLPAYADGDF